MKHEDLQKLKFILEQESKSKASNSEELSRKKLREYVDKCNRGNLNKDEIINNVYMMWEIDHQQKSDYQKMVVKNQIIEFIKGENLNYTLMIWYFKDNKQPFYVDIKPKKIKGVIDNKMLQSLVNDYPCEYNVLKDKISEIEAIKLKKQIIYYYHVLGQPLLNHKEMN